MCNCHTLTNNCLTVSQFHIKQLTHLELYVEVMPFIVPCLPERLPSSLDLGK